MVDELGIFATSFEPTCQRIMCWVCCWNLFGVSGLLKRMSRGLNPASPPWRWDDGTTIYYFPRLDNSTVGRWIDHLFFLSYLHFLPKVFWCQTQLLSLCRVHQEQNVLRFSLVMSVSRLKLCISHAKEEAEVRNLQHHSWTRLHCKAWKNIKDEEEVWWRQFVVG